ncbi:MAG: hypothetical protein WBJ75_12510 [Pseudohongiellaceae bacterium]
MDKKTITSDQPSRYQLGVLFGEIASQASILNDALNEYTDGDEKPGFYAFFAMVEKIGFLADFGAKGGGWIPVRGGAEWFLPPVYRYSEDEKPGGLADSEAQKLAES